MYKYIKAVTPKLIIRMLFHIIYIAAIASLPYIIKNMIDDDYTQGIEKAGVHIVTFVCMIAVGMLAQYVSQKMAWRAECDLNKRMRKDLFHAMIRKPATEFEKKSIGEYTSMLENDVGALGEYIEYCLEAMEYIFSLFTYAIFLFALDIRIAATIYLVTIGTLFLPKLTAKKLAARKNHLLEATGYYISKVNDLLAGYPLINQYTKKGVAKRHYRSLDEMEEGRYAYGKYKSFVNIFNGSMMYLIDISAFIIIVLLLVKGQITAGVATATITYIREFAAPLRGVIDSLSAVKSVSGVKNKLLAEIERERQITKNIEFLHDIVFEHVYVKYADFELRDFNFKFEKGKKYALVGESGSGKSTILRLMMKNILPDSGRILIDGQDIADLDMASMAAYIKQNTHIFAESFFNNITVFGCYSLKKVQELKPLLENVSLSAIAEKEDCAKVSGGEKQLIAFFRMLAADREILILDEPFSAVDKRREMLATKMLLDGNKNTVIMVTHNTAPEFLEQFDIVIKMEQGKIG